MGIMGSALPWDLHPGGPMVDRDRGQAGREGRREKRKGVGGILRE